MVLSIRKKIAFGFILIIILTVLFLEAIIINIVRNNYYNNLEANLHNQLKVSCELYSRYFSDASLQDNVLNNVDTFWKQTNAQVQIIDTDGRVLMDSIGYMPKEDERLPDVEEALEKGKGTWTGKVTYDKNGIMAVSRTLHSNEETAGVLRFISSLRVVNEDVKAVSRLFIIIGFVVTVASVILSFFLSNTIINPLKKVTNVAARMASGDFQVRSKKVYNDEIGRLSDTLNYMADEIEKRDKLKNDFISSISHELRTPLTSIKGWAITLMEVGQENRQCAAGYEKDEQGSMQADMGNSDALNHIQDDSCVDAQNDVQDTQNDGQDDRELFETGLDIIEKECDRLTAMVEELLDFSRLVSDKLSIRKELVQLEEFVDTVGRQLAPRAAREGLHFSVEVEGELPDIVTDGNRLKQVIINVLDNAFRFTPANGKVFFNVTTSGGEVIFSIVDTGCGIPADEMPYIKEKFFKGKKSKLGNGIGLSICDEIIRLMNGSFSLYSTEGKGTKVVIRIPAVSDGEVT
ncbi:MAG: HAMP domain-containing protein [Clostridiaceae bacterium]|jgi:signal transduction histidine kinase|nr:HAMP domain-containing protein [Clostridiaceae bacterium]